MDYSSLYEIWKKENENTFLQNLNKMFYLELSEYIKIHREELQMLDEQTLRAKLTKIKGDRIKKLFKDILWMRSRKIFENVLSNKSISVELLSQGEEQILKDVLSAFEKIKRLEREILEGHIPILDNTNDINTKKKNLLVRLVQSIPAIVGTNTKIYGPFKAEDLASLPVENAESLIKRGIAVKVELE